MRLAQVALHSSYLSRQYECSVSSSCLQTLSFNDLFGSDMLKDHNIVETAAEMLRHRVTRLRDRLHSNMLTLEVGHRYHKCNVWIQLSCCYLLMPG